MSLLLEVVDKIQNFEYNLDFLPPIRQDSYTHSLFSLVKKVFETSSLIKIMITAVLRQDMYNLDSKFRLVLDKDQQLFLNNIKLLETLGRSVKELKIVSVREIRDRLENQLETFLVSLKLDNPELYNFENISAQDSLQLARIYCKYCQYKQMIKHYESVISPEIAEIATETSCRRRNTLASRNLQTNKDQSEIVQSTKIQAMVELGKHYKYIGDYKTMSKYLNDATSLGSTDAMKLMLEYFSSNKHSGTVPMLEKLRFLYEHGMLKESHFNYVEIKLDAEMLQFIAEMDVKKVKGGFREFGYISVIRNLVKEKIDQLDLHFRYAPTGEGYKEALADFYETMVDSQKESDDEVKE